METIRLFYEDPHLKTFSATVVTCQQAGQYWAVTLSQTAFYPEGGGEVCDTGFLGDARVLDVQEQDDTIIHTCDRPLAAGSTVRGEIDWARRFDQMQQHTGEHIVSGIIFRTYGFHNSGYHVGSDGMEVDFDGVISPEDIPFIEQKANEAVWANLPVRCWFPEKEVLPTLSYRTKRALPWPVRIVDIQGADSCACCGIHVKHTGEVGLIKISSCTKLRGGVRLVIRCGQRALQHVHQVYEQNRLVSQAFSAQMLQTGEAAAKMNEALAAEKLRANALQKEVFFHIAGQYSGNETAVHFQEGLPPQQLRELADAIANAVSGWAAVFSPGDTGTGYCLASRDADLRELNKALTASLCGRGGGKPNFQQGSLSATREEIEAFFAQQQA